MVACYQTYACGLNSPAVRHYVRDLRPRPVIDPFQAVAALAAAAVAVTPQRAITARGLPSLLL